MPATVREPPAKNSFINLDLTRQLAAVARILHRQSDSLKHDPSGLLGNADSTVKFVAGDSVLAVSEHPHCKKPLVQRNCRIFKDSPDLDAELGLGMPSLALRELREAKKLTLLEPYEGHTTRPSSAAPRNR